MKIVADKNIIFSAVLNSDGMIGNLLFHPKIKFYSCNYMRFEILKHKEKLKNISKLTDEQLEFSVMHIFSKINFINEELIPDKIWDKAEEFVKDIDLNDIDFVALTLFLKAKLWTGDKKLYHGLKLKNFNNIFNTADLAAQF